MDAPRGVWIWQLAKIDPDYIARMASAGIARVYLKVMDGASQPMFWGHQCTPSIVQSFKTAGIEVYGWGYHHAVGDPSGEIAAVQSAIACHLDGYVVDIEREAEVSGAASKVDALLTGLKPLVSAGRLGYTSFGAPQFHKTIPWQVLNEKTDFAMPQIYFEQFDFGSSNAEEVAACMSANRGLPGIKDILPVWSSEDGAKHPATAVELQSYLDKFQGSSIWRVPHLTEKGEAWNLRYDGEAPAIPDLVAATRSMGYIVRRGASGRDVAAIRALLTALGYPSSGPADEFNDSLEAAVRQFQTIAGIAVDGKVGPETIAALAGDAPVPMLELGRRERLALVAQTEGGLQLRWVDANSPAEKYLQPLRAEMHRRGQIGASPVFFNWCGAFVLWCCREAGYALPDAPTDPPHYFATYALVAAWVEWAKAKGFWLSNDAEAARGDIVVFNWFDGGSQFDHIGIVSSFTVGSPSFRTSEGNSRDQTINQTRFVHNVSGYIRLPETGV